MSALWHDKMGSEEFYAKLDPGIRFAVRLLHAHGIETGQSCQGGAGHAYNKPTVDLQASARGAEGFEALAVLRSSGLPVSSVSIHWPVNDGLPFEKNWRIEFKTSMEDRADDKPMFVWGYHAR